jgi:hypothetical protein
MSFLKTLFGGSETRQQQTSGPTEVTPQIFRELREPVAGQLTGLIGDPLAQGGGAFGQPFAVGQSPLEAALLGRVGEAFTGPQTGPAAQELLMKTLQGGFLGPESNPFLRAAIESAQRPVLEGLTETLGRVLPGRFTQAGQFTQPGGSSAFDRAAAIATRGAGQSLADISTNLSFANLEQERGRQQEAVRLSQEDVTQTIEGLKAAALPRLIEQFGVDRALEEFNARITRVLEALQIATGVPLINIAQQSQQTGTTDQFAGVFNKATLLANPVIRG